MGTRVCRWMVDDGFWRIVARNGWPIRKGVEKQMAGQRNLFCSSLVCKHPLVNQQDTVKRTVNSKAIESINSNNRVTLERTDGNPGDANDAVTKCQTSGLRSIELFVSVHAVGKSGELSVSQRSPHRWNTRMILRASLAVPFVWKTRVMRAIGRSHRFDHVFRAISDTAVVPRICDRSF